MISLNALDRFAADHLFFQVLCSKACSGTGISTSPTDAELVIALIEIRRHVSNGAIDEATAIVEKLCPDVVHDPELQLEIRIHKLFELIYNTQTSLKESPQQQREAVQKALEFSQHLAEFALHAFPDAYSRFTQSMMLFAFPGQAVSFEALTEKRNVLSGNLVSLVRMRLGARGSCLSFLIRYLLIINVQAKSLLKGTNEDKTAHNELVSELLPRKDESDSVGHIPWGVDDVRFVKSKTSEEYSVAEVQALRERVNITRQQCVKSLCFTNGDAFAALRNELGRINMNEKLFELLVMDYCAARGLECFETSVAVRKNVAEVLPRMSSDMGTSDPASLMISRSSLEMYSCMHKLRHHMARGDDCDIRHLISIRDLLPKTSKRLDFRLSLRHVLFLLRSNELAESLHYCREKIGPMVRERPALLSLLSDVLLLIVYAYDYEGIKESEDASLRAQGLDIDTEERGLTDMKNDSDRINSEKSSPFHIKLTDAYDRVSRFSSVESILSEAYETLESEYGEPKLVTILKQLITAHKEWQTKNQLKDQFGDKFGIQSLQRGVEHQLSYAQECTNRDSDLNEASNDTACKENAREETSEETILALMDFLAMTRAEALTAVRNHPLANDPQAMVDFVLSSMT